MSENASQDSKDNVQEKKITVELTPRQFDIVLHWYEQFENYYGRVLSHVHVHTLLRRAREKSKC